MNKNSKFLLLLSICIISVIGIFFVIKGKELDIESEEVKKLYHYLGEENESHCNELSVYKDKIVTKDDISLENKLCLAYFETENKEIGELPITGSNKNKAKICKKGEITFTSDDNTCHYTKVSKEELNNNYKTIYGEDISEFKTFYIDSKTACHLKGDYYLCGGAETYSFSISAPTDVYRVLTKAIKKGEEIILTDYYLKISNGKCYTNESSENSDCTKAIENNEIDVAFVKKYGAEYEHVFKNEKNTPYHWVKSYRK